MLEIELLQSLVDDDFRFFHKTRKYGQLEIELLWSMLVTLANLTTKFYILIFCKNPNLLSQDSANQSNLFLEKNCC